MNERTMETLLNAVLAFGLVISVAMFVAFIFATA